MYDRCVAGDILRTVMSSIMRRRRGLIVAIGYLLSGGLGFDNHNPQTGDLCRKHSFPRQRVSSIPWRNCKKIAGVPILSGQIEISNPRRHSTQSMGCRLFTVDWVSKSHAKVADALQKQGHAISASSVKDCC